MSVVDMVEPKEKIFGSCGDVFIHACNFGRICT